MYNEFADDCWADDIDRDDGMLDDILQPSAKELAKRIALPEHTGLTEQDTRLQYDPTFLTEADIDLLNKRLVDTLG